MIARVVRTSGSDDQPCEETRPAPYTITARLSGRSITYTDWLMDIGTMDELIDFSQKYGELVFDASKPNEDAPQGYDSTPRAKVDLYIEIYDGHRE